MVSVLHFNEERLAATSAFLVFTLSGIRPYAVMNLVEFSCGSGRVGYSDLDPEQFFPGSRSLYCRYKKGK